MYISGEFAGHGNERATHNRQFAVQPHSRQACHVCAHFGVLLSAVKERYKYK